MNAIIKMMPKELNVIKYLIYFSFFLIFTNCDIQKNDYYKYETYEIVRKKSKRGFTQLNIVAYEYENKSVLIPAYAIINGVIKHLDILNSNSTNIIYLKSDKYNLEINFIGKETIYIKNLLIKNSDSIIIKAYMKEDLTPIY